MADKGQDKEIRVAKSHEIGSRISDFVLDKFIFSNIFEKDIRRIYIYRKSERLAKAIQLITPAFGAAPSLRNRLDSIAVGLIDAAVMAPASAREALSRELLALSSILSVARTGGLLSDMNADLITREAHQLLQEIASYEEPRLFLEESLSLAELSKRAPDAREYERREVPISAPVSTAPSIATSRASESASPKPQTRVRSTESKGQDKGHSSSSATTGSDYSDRQQSILSILASKGPSYIKDISIVIREVSEKTIQRELQALVMKGVVQRTGDRRWTQYSIPA